MSFFASLREAWRNRGTLGDDRMGDVERTFLPAAPEIQETPPSPVGRFMAWSVMVLFSIALVWACVGKVDIVTTADGKTIPSGYVKQIQPLEKGVVKSILVKEGQVVRQGQPLIELDRTLTGADQSKFSQELAFQEMTIKRQELFVKLLANPGQGVNIEALKKELAPQSPNPLTPLRGAKGAQGFAGQAADDGAGRLTREANGPLHPDGGRGSGDRGDLYASDQLALLLQQWRAHQTQRETLQAQLREKQAEKLSSLELVRQLEATVPLIAKRANSSKTLS